MTDGDEERADAAPEQDTELKLPEDLEPDEDDADGVTGGKVPGNAKYNDITLKRGSG